MAARIGPAVQNQGAADTGTEGDAQQDTAAPAAAQSVFPQSGGRAVIHNGYLERRIALPEESGNIHTL